MRSFVASFAAAVALLAAPAHAQAPAWQAGTDGLRPVPALSARVTDLTNTLTADERARLESKLASFEGNISRTADMLGVERSNLYRKMRGLGITPRREEEESA